LVLYLLRSAYSRHKMAAIRRAFKEKIEPDDAPMQFLELNAEHERQNQVVTYNTDGSSSFKRTEEKAPEPQVGFRVVMVPGFVFATTVVQVDKKFQGSVSTVDTEVEPIADAQVAYLGRIEVAVQLFIGRARVTIKSFISYIQIACNIAFNCAIEFPPIFSKIVINFSIVANFDFLPALKLPCYGAITGGRFDYIDSMVITTTMPIILCCLLGLAYLSSKVGELRRLFENKYWKRGLKLNSLVDVMAERARCNGEIESEPLQVSAVEIKAFFSQREIAAYRATFDEIAGGKEFCRETDLRIKISSLNPDASGEAVNECAVQILAEASDDAWVLETTLTFEMFLKGQFRAYHEQVLEPERSPKVSASFAREVEARRKSKLGQTVFGVFLTVTFFALVGTSTTVFHYFKCHDFPEAEGGVQSYLRKDYAIDCKSPRYATFLIYAILMIFIYPFGIPCLYAVVLSQQHKILSSAEAVAWEETNDYPRTGHVTFLFVAYKPEYYLYEVVECVRRLSLASVIGMLPAETASSPTTGFIICIFFNFVLTTLQPFLRSDDNSLGIVLSYSLSFFFLAAILIKVDATKDDKDEQRTLDVLLVILLFWGPLSIITGVLEGFRNHLRGRLNMKNVRLIAEGGGIEMIDDVFNRHKTKRLFRVWQLNALRCAEAVVYNECVRSFVLNMGYRPRNDEISAAFPSSAELLNLKPRVTKFESLTLQGRSQAKKLIGFREGYESSKGLSPMLRLWMAKRRPGGVRAALDKFEASTRVPMSPGRRKNVASLQVAEVDISGLGDDEAAALAAWNALIQNTKTVGALKIIFQDAKIGPKRTKTLNEAEFEHFLDLAGIKGVSKKQARGIMASAREKAGASSGASSSLPSRRGEITFAQLSSALPNHGRATTPHADQRPSGAFFAEEHKATVQTSAPVSESIGDISIRSSIEVGNEVRRPGPIERSRADGAKPARRASAPSRSILLIDGASVDLTSTSSTKPSFSAGGRNEESRRKESAVPVPERRLSFGSLDHGQLSPRESKSKNKNSLETFFAAEYTSIGLTNSQVPTSLGRNTPPSSLEVARKARIDSKRSERFLTKNVTRRLNQYESSKSHENISNEKREAGRAMPASRAGAPSRSIRYVPENVNARRMSSTPMPAGAGSAIGHGRIADDEALDRAESGLTPARWTSRTSSAPSSGVPRSAPSLGVPRFGSKGEKKRVVSAREARLSGVTSGFLSSGSSGSLFTGPRTFRARAPK